MPNEWINYFTEVQDVEAARERVRSVSFRSRQLGEPYPERFIEPAGDFAPIERVMLHESAAPLDYTIADSHFGRVIGVDTGRFEHAQQAVPRRERIRRLEQQVEHLEQQLEAAVPHVVDDGLTMLPRTGAKGQFVLYPKEWQPQWRDPRNRRFQTKCDMLAGPCSCGRRHMPEDADVQENLSRYGCKIETMQQWRDRLYA